MAQSVSHTYSVLADGLVGDYPNMWADVIQALGWAYLAQIRKGDE